MDPGRPSFPIMKEANYNMYCPDQNYYAAEPDDDVLESFAEDQKILCTFLFYSPDIRHVEVLPRVQELVALTNIKAGIAITAQWYQMAPEMLEMINLPSEKGGIFPNVEPMICSAGMAASAISFIDP